MIFEYEYQSDFARIPFQFGYRQGLWDGTRAGMREAYVAVMQRQLALRFGPLPPRAAASIAAATLDQLNELCVRLLTAESLPVALGPLNELHGEGVERERARAERFFREGWARGRLEGRLEGALRGQADGRREGQVDLVARLLRLRFGAAAEGVLVRLAPLTPEGLAAVGERALRARTIEEAFGSQ